MNIKCHGRSGLPACLFLLLTLATLGKAATFTTTIPPAKGERYGSADYRIWIPDGVKTLRSVIIKQHGCGRNGLSHADDLQWQELARKRDSALLGTWLKSSSTNCADWGNPDYGSGRALLEALKRLGAAARHAELENVPWVLWGHSGGAYWCHAMAIRIPERVAGMVLQSGALTVTNASVLKIPTLLIRGTNDFPTIVQRVDTAFKMHRPRGGLWSMAINPIVEHECGEARTLAIPFLDAVLGSRLPTPAPVDGVAELLRLDPDQGWLGDPVSLGVSKPSDYKADKSMACWFPSEKIAMAWQEFSIRGLVEDKTPPPAPDRLRFSTVGGVELIWMARADLESGVNGFNIYRDGAKIATWRGGEDRDEHSGFQKANLGDEPEPVEPRMRYVDFRASPGHHVYQVTTLNWAALESEKSPAVEVRAK